ncbi:MAG: hypothetical protein NT081_07440 [Actinobacteria bacterium]|nr:hypothetical protein [Actinomycetota bacterium]
MTTDVQAAVELNPLTGESRPISEWTTNFHLAFVVLDPFTNESSWILKTALRILRDYSEADVRIALLVTATESEVRDYVGPLASEILVFVDPDRTVAKAFGLETLPAFVHINQAHQVEASAQGWNPQEWAAVATNLSARMDWTVPEIPVSGDPSPFSGTAI